MMGSIITLYVLRVSLSRLLRMKDEEPSKWQTLYVSTFQWSWVGLSLPAACAVEGDFFDRASGVILA